MLDRRSFLSGASSLAICVATQALAGLHLHGTSGATGRATLNGFFNAANPFANFFKSWSGTPPDPSVQDANQYPNNVAGAAGGATLPVAITGQISLPSNTAGPFVLKWQGKGAIFFDVGTSPTATITQNGGGNAPYVNTLFISELGTSGTGAVNFHLTASGTNGRIVFSFAAASSGVSCNFQAGFNYVGMNNAILCRLADEAICDADQNAFNPDFISSLVAIKSRTLRTMDWAATNNSNMAQHALRTPPTSFCMFQTWVPGLWGGSTSGTDTYTAANPSNSGGGAYIDGESVQVNFVNANTITTPSLQLGARGFKTIKSNQGQALSAGNIGANSLATLVYNKILDVWLCWFGVGLSSFVPVELQVALCNAVNQNLWHCWPFLYTDASVSADVAYIAANLKTGLNAYVEYTNELWNFANTQTQLAHQLGLALGFPDNNNRAFFDDWYGLRVRMTMALATTAWAGRSGLYRVMAFQQYASQSNTNTFRFQGADLAPLGTGTGQGNAAYSSYTGSANYTAFPNRPIDFCDVFSYAPYYNGAQIGTAFDGGYNTIFSLILGGPDANSGGIGYTGLLGAADAFAAGGASNISQALAFVDWDVNQGISPTTTNTTVISGNPGAATFTQGSVLGVVATGSIVAFGTTGTLPIGITAGKNYFVINSNGSNFQVSLTSGGSAVTISSAGSGTHYYGQDSFGTTLKAQNIFVNPGWDTIFSTYTGKTVECYEGGLQIQGPSTAECTALGISTTYGGLTGKIQNLIVAYKLNALCKATVLAEFTTLQAYTNPVRPCWYTHLQDTIQLNSPWSLYESDLYSTKYTTYDALVQYNN